MFRALLSVFLSGLLIQQGAATDTELTAFEDVVSDLLLGQHLDLVFNSEECGVDLVRNYDEVKAALVGGKHVNRVINYEQCEGEPLSGIPKRIIGSNDELTYIMKPGDNGEHAEFMDQEYAKTDQMDVFAQTTILDTAGNIQTIIELWNLQTWQVDLESTMVSSPATSWKSSLIPSTVSKFPEEVRGLTVFTSRTSSNGKSAQSSIQFTTNHFRNDEQPVLEFEQFDIFSDGNMYMSYAELAEAVELGYHMTTVIDVSQCESNLVGDTALYLGMSFYELFETMDKSNATKVLTEHRHVVNLGESIGVMSIPGTFQEGGTVTWDVAVLVPNGQGGLMNLYEGTTVTCDLSGAKQPYSKTSGVIDRSWWITG
ncbi:unnamed protein product [Cyprideis torosa]|uniref:Uncharacterized protein n=1 Tax=Cyprideis torosa TaxID=163714 RepID=A0A7R8ZQ18_9CRUS|nr:unnamed protein product [Cyprideis torosa]CAG0900298.1 unnamed protein product [Cyprideis torosa]